jgi:hypothetical protein
VGGSISSGRVVVVAVPADAGDKFGDGTSVCVCDIGDVRLIDGMRDVHWVEYGRRSGRSGSLKAAVEFNRAL